MPRERFGGVWFVGVARSCGVVAGNLNANVPARLFLA